MFNQRVRNMLDKSWGDMVEVVDEQVLVQHRAKILRPLLRYSQVIDEQTSPAASYQPRYQDKGSFSAESVKSLAC